MVTGVGTGAMVGAGVTTTVVLVQPAAAMTRTTRPSRYASFFNGISSLWVAEKTSSYLSPIDVHLHDNSLFSNDWITADQSFIGSNRDFEMSFSLNY